MASPAPILLPAIPTAPQTDWRPVPQSFDGTRWRRFDLARVETGAIWNHFTRAGYPSQTSVGSSSGNGYTATVQGTSDLVYDATNDNYDLKLVCNTSGNFDDVSRALGTTLTFGTDAFALRFRLVVDVLTGSSGQLHVALGNSANTAGTNNMGLVVELGTGNFFFQVADSVGAVNPNINMGFAPTIGTSVWIEMMHDPANNGWALNFYLNRFIRPFRTFAQARSKAGTVDEFVISNRGDSGSGTLEVTIDEVSVQIPDALAVPTSQPEEVFQEIDSGAANAVWDMSSISIDGTDKEFQFSAVNVAGVPVFNGTWLSLASLQAETDPAGRHFTLKARPDHTAGTLQTYLTGGTIDVSTAIAIPPVPAVVIADPVIGDDQVTIEVSGTSGNTVNSFFRRAGTNELPTTGETRLGDGPLTVTSMANRTMFELFVQTDDGAGNFSVSSRVLFVTPRASGASDLQNIITEIRNLMLLVPGIGNVHERRRLTRFWDKFYSRHKADGKLINWEITRTVREQAIDAVEGAATSEPFFQDLHLITIFGHMAIHEETESEIIFQKLIDDVADQIRVNNRLNNAVLLPRQLQVPAIGEETFGGVLCHMALMEFEAIPRVGG